MKYLYNDLTQVTRISQIKLRKCCQTIYMKLEFILNIIKAIIKVEGLSKAVMVMGDLRGSFFSSWDLQVFWLDSSEHKNNSRSLYFTDFLLWPGAQEATQSVYGSVIFVNSSLNLHAASPLPQTAVFQLSLRTLPAISLGCRYFIILRACLVKSNSHLVINLTNVFHTSVFKCDKTSWIHS